jgi:hypothetical protein
MIIAVDTTIVTYALKMALISDNTDEVQYICQRITEAVPQMQRTLCVWLLQDIDDWLTAHPDATYLKISPIKRLRECLQTQHKEFK